MTERERENIRDRELRHGRVPAAGIEKFWGRIESQLRLMEGWTQCISADDIRRGLDDGSLRLWGAIDPSERAAFAITRITSSSRGSICTLWMIASHLHDDAALSALLDEGETFARAQACAVLEVHAYPELAACLKVRVTGVILERDLRAARRVN